MYLQINYCWVLFSLVCFTHEINVIKSPMKNSAFTVLVLMSFHSHEDLKTMLDSNRDNQKLEAMKRIIGV